MVLSHPILPSKKLLYQLHNTILQYIQHPNFYFPILLIKIIFLHNKIIYSKIISSFTISHYLFFLPHSFRNNHKFTETTYTTSPPPLHYTQLTPPSPATHNLPSTPKTKTKQKKSGETIAPIHHQHNQHQMQQPTVPTIVSKTQTHRKQNPDPRWQTHSHNQ